MIKSSHTATSQLRALVAASVLLVAAGAAQAVAGPSFVDVDISGWQATAGFGEAGNSETFLQLGSGQQITGFDYFDLRFISQGASYRSEFVLSVNNSTANGYMDWAPSNQLSPGSEGPISGAWGGPDGDGIGAPFNLDDGPGTVWVAVYDTLDDDVVDAVVATGTLRIYYAAAVPEPSTYGLMALGLLGVAGVARRRQGR